MKNKKNKKPNKRAGKEVSKGEKPLPTEFRLQAKVYFLTYKGISESGKKLTKKLLANFLLNQNKNEVKLKPEKYLICEQMYDSGEPHFHAILIYPRKKHIANPNFYDYLNIHPNIQTMRNMKAALDYVYKEDPHPYTNMDVVQQKRIARAKDTSSLYQFLEQQMKKDPFNFEVYSFCQKNNLTKHIYQANYTKAVNLLKKAQEAHLNSLLRSKAGFKPIDQALISSRLSESELKTFYSWSGYQTIVNYLNIMNSERGNRQQKSLNLLITGAPSTGKSALFWQRNPLPGRTSVVTHLPLYPMGMKDWFPEYQSDVYAGIYWNETKLTSYSFDVILQLLDGSPIMLPSKGSSHKKVDNPLVIMTSNMTLDQMIQNKFFYNKEYQKMAKSNLKVRIENVIIPKNHNLFLLQKLLVPKEEPENT